jgi:hypothetical protein
VFIVYGIVMKKTVSCGKSEWLVMKGAKEMHEEECAQVPT